MAKKRPPLVVDSRDGLDRLRAEVKEALDRRERPFRIRFLEIAAQVAAGDPTVPEAPRPDR